MDARRMTWVFIISSLSIPRSRPFLVDLSLCLSRSFLSDDILLTLVRSLVGKLTRDWLWMNFLLGLLSQNVLEFMLAIFLFTAIINCNTNFVLVLKLTVLDIASDLPHVWLSHHNSSVVVRIVVVPRCRLGCWWNSFSLSLVVGILWLMSHES